VALPNRHGVFTLRQESVMNSSSLCSCNLKRLFTNPNIQPRCPCIR
ncbi:hypothetical protein THOM_0231, partial [Trachipleistophora hominis]